MYTDLEQEWDWLSILDADEPDVFIASNDDVHVWENGDVEDKTQYSIRAHHYQEDANKKQRGA